MIFLRPPTRLTSRSTNLMTTQNPDPTQETRTRILEAAVKVFATKGYHDTKVDDIVSESSTSKGSFYFYFPSKQDIFLALSDTFADLLESKITQAMEKEAHGMQQMDCRSALQPRLVHPISRTGKDCARAGCGIGSRVRGTPSRHQQPPDGD